MKKILFAEWTPHMECFRIYSDEAPEQTIAYEDDLRNTYEYARMHGYLVAVQAEEERRI